MLILQGLTGCIGSEFGSLHHLQHYKLFQKSTETQIGGQRYECFSTGNEDTYQGRDITRIKFKGTSCLYLRPLANFPLDY